MSKKRPLRVATPYRLAAHHFHKTFRRPPDGLSWQGFFQLVSRQRFERELAFGRMFQTLLIVFVALAASGPAPILDIKTEFIDVSIPKIYLVFALSAIAGYSLLEMLGSLFMSELQRRTANKFRRDFPLSNFLAITEGSNSIYSVIFTSFYSPIMQPARLDIAQGALLVMIGFPVIMIYGGVYALVFIQLVAYLNSAMKFFMGGYFAALSILMLVVPPCLFVLALVPMPLRKNIFAIRWGFLYRIYRRSGVTPAHVSNWLDEKKT